MWAAAVEVGHMLFEHAEQMVLVEDEDIIEALAAGTAEIALADGIGLRRSHGCAQHPDAARVRDTIEVDTELVVVVTDQEPWALVEWRGVA